MSEYLTRIRNGASRAYASAFRKGPLTTGAAIGFTSSAVFAIAEYLPPRLDIAINVVIVGSVVYVSKNLLSSPGAYSGKRLVGPYVAGVVVGAAVGLAALHGVSHELYDNASRAMLVPSQHSSVRSDHMQSSIVAHRPHKSPKVEEVVYTL